MAVFDHKSWRRLYRLARPFFFSDSPWKARGLLLLLLGLSLSIKGFDVVMSYIGADFVTSLTMREQDKFTHSIFLYLLAFCVAIPLSVFYRYTEERLALMWRRWFTHHTLDRYFANQGFYRLGWYKQIDNPDQRIEEDIRSFTSTSLSLFLIFLQSTIALFLFVGVLSSISWMLTVTVVIYALFGSTVTYFLGRPLIDLNFEQLRREADYRYKLIKVRDNAESIAFYRGESKERTRVRQRLKDVLRNMLRIINRNRTLNFFTTGYNYMVIILPTIVVAPLYLRGEIPFGKVSQSAVAFGYVLNALSIMVTNFGSLSAYAAVVRRLGVFSEVLTDASSPRSLSGFQTGKEVRFSNVTILTPDSSRVLIADLSFSVATGGLLICGPSGCGKSSVLRVLAGLWAAKGGEIVRPPADKCMFVPQRPYLTLGSLRSQLLYAQNRSGFSDAELHAVLKEVELEEMFRRVGGFDATVDWSSTLSNGEQQRIGIARLILAKPQHVFLDEATTAIDEAGEERLYRKIRSFASTVVSVGYRTNLQHFHEQILELHGDGKWHIDTNIPGRT